MVRFANGAPQALWYSQHASGQAFTYQAVEKQGKRPLSYSGNGTHANYAIAGYVLLLHLSLLPPLDSSLKHSIFQTDWALCTPCTANMTTPFPASTFPPDSFSTTLTVVFFGIPLSTPGLIPMMWARRCSPHRAQRSPLHGWISTDSGVMTSLPGSHRSLEKPNM